MTKIQWTSEIWETADALMARKMTRSDIAAALGCSMTAYKSALQDRRDKMRRGRGGAGHARPRVRWFQETWEKVDALTSKGAGEEEICTAIGCTVDAYRTARLMRKRKDAPKAADGRAGAGWSDDELAYLREHYGHDMQTVEIGRRLGRGVPGIWAKARELGLQGKAQEDPITDAQAEEVLRRLGAGEKMKDIAAAMGRGCYPLTMAARRLRKAARIVKPEVPRPAHPSHQKTTRPAGAYPAGHPVTWGILQALLSPEHREAWPERPPEGALRVSCLSGVSRYIGRPKEHQRPQTPGLLETWALLGERRAA